MISRLIVLAVLLVLPEAGWAQQPISREISSDLEVTEDLAYARYGDRVLMLDLYRPAQRSSALLPAVVVIRGGSWRRGDKERFGPMAAALAERGLAAVSIEYRTSDEATFPAAVHDTKAAVRWLRRNADRFGLDANAIGAIGGSAGGHLALYLGVTSDMADLEGEHEPGSLSSRVSAIVGLAAHTDLSLWREEAAVEFLGVSYEEDPDLWRFASPITHVTESAPPALLLHSEADTGVSIEHPLLLARRYGEAGAEIELFLFPEAPHAFWNFEEWFADTMDRAAAFFRRHLGQ